MVHGTTPISGGICRLGHTRALFLRRPSLDSRLESGRRAQPCASTARRSPLGTARRRARPHLRAMVDRRRRRRRRSTPAPPARVAVRRSPGRGHSLAQSHGDPALDGAPAAASARRAPPLFFSAVPAQWLLPNAPVAEPLNTFMRLRAGAYRATALSFPLHSQGNSTRSVYGSLAPAYADGWQPATPT